MSASTSNPLAGLLLDPYDRRARALPLLLCLLPILMVLVLVYPAFVQWQQAVFGVLVWCGGFFLLSRIARDAGRRIQDRLFAAWSGAPTTQLLRHRDRRIDAYSKQALHAKLAALTGIPMPTARTEQEDPAGADEAYRAAAAWLIKHTRDTTRFGLLYKENVNFGFQRNALGLRWVGVAIATLSVLWVLVMAGVLSPEAPYYNTGRWAALSLPMGLSLLASGTMLAIWLFAITPGAAQRTGFAYAERLLECAEACSADRSGSAVGS
jgi:hypothetical protein